MGIGGVAPRPPHTPETLRIGCQLCRMECSRNRMPVLVTRDFFVLRGMQLSRDDHRRAHRRGERLGELSLVGHTPQVQALLKATT